MNNICDCTAINNDKVQRVQDNLISDDEISILANFFQVLGDNTRMKILISLSQEELCVCDLAVVLNMTKSAVSHQLKKLKNGRQVKSRKDGKNVYYSLDDEHIVDIINRSLEHSRHK